MSFHVVFIKKRNLIIIFIVAIAIICSAVFLLKNNPNSKDVFNLVNSEDISFKKDFTGDGIEDVLYIGTKDNLYHMYCNSKNKNINILPNERLPSLGKYDPCWPMKISFLDINRDRLPEIFIQDSLKDVPIQHIFIYEKDKYIDILCNNNNIMGFLDSNDGKTPKFVSGIYNNGSLKMNYYIADNNNLKKHNFNPKEFPGENPIKSFINYMESLPYGEENKPSIFYDGFQGEDLYCVGKISAESSKIKFQDGYFQDIKWNKSGFPSEILWTINLKSWPKNQGASPQNYILNVTIKEDSNNNNELRVSAIYIKK